METNKTTRCYACGDERAGVYLRPFGRAADGQPKTWVCDGCDRAGVSVRRAPPISGSPALRMSTVLRAEALARLGFGASSDMVVRRALDLLESRTA